MKGKNINERGEWQNGEHRSRVQISKSTQNQNHSPALNYIRWGANFLKVALMYACIETLQPTLPNNYSDFLHSNAYAKQQKTKKKITQ